MKMFPLRFRIRRRAGVALLLLLPAFGAHAQGRSEAEQTLIIYNSRVSNSRWLADYYAKKRGVPSKNICPVSCTDRETIKRGDFERRIFDPTLRFMEKRGFIRFAEREIEVPVADDESGATRRVKVRFAADCSILYAVVMHGVPLQVLSDQEWEDRLPVREMAEPLRKNGASVDAELAMLPSPDVPRMGPQTNPYFGVGAPFAAPMNRAMILVTRLDGPGMNSIRRMLDESLAGEQLGLRGRAYFDLRGLPEKSGHRLGDEWIRGAYEAALRAGFDCVLDEKSPVFPETAQVTDAALYFGWYTRGVEGALARPDFRFRPSAVAYHLHSNSAGTLRDPGKYWVAPLIARGVDATMGCTSEPYLRLTPHVDVFLEKLLDGYNLAESAYQSMPALSWQIVVVGDPLYRPCGIPIEQQIANARADAPEELPWLLQRKANMLARQGNAEGALEICREVESPILDETAAELLSSLGRIEDSAAAWEHAVRGRRNARDKVRVELKRVAFLVEHERRAEALDILDDVLFRHREIVDTKGILERMQALAEQEGDEDRLAQIAAALSELLGQEEGTKSE